MNGAYACPHHWGRPCDCHRTEVGNTPTRYQLEHMETTDLLALQEHITQVLKNRFTSVRYATSTNTGDQFNDR